jgi:hypothetical protein
MNNSYLINLILVLIPIALAFDKRFQIFKDWRGILPAVVITGIATAVFKLAFVHYHLLSYDLSTVSDVFFFEIPLESALFCFTVPFAGIGIYNYLNSLFFNNDLEKYSLALSNILLGLGIAIIFFAYTKAYAVTTFVVLLLLLFYVEYVNKYRFMYKFYRTFAVFIVLYALWQLLFAGYRSLAYNIDRTLNFNLIKVPFENYFLLGAILLLAVYFFEYFKRRNNGTT